ncbi:hypothetical protein AUR64_11375 [Haloprofundus marisrubri]|uniref:DUF7960 domain-containing protein n=1 Tax=Haloprofundus marisrubri TaxID=1514971 RepID=A0A0W1R962_9EURY|nr:hypothetical protein [Haloprofundus marisrubri]KTG10180.1 hypothetical protein AUR64_11375 [Haloprofundus marisrubri]
MYTGKTEKPCCLCGEKDTVTRLDLPPRAVTLMRNSDPIAWRDIVGEVSIHFCGSDWETVVDLVSNLGMSPLSRCNVAYASFDLREDFEALLNATRDEPDQTETERRLLDKSARALEDDDAEQRAVVEAKVVRWALEDLGVAPS